MSHRDLPGPNCGDSGCLAFGRYKDVYISPGTIRDHHNTPPYAPIPQGPSGLSSTVSTSFRYTLGNYQGSNFRRAFHRHVLMGVYPMGVRAMGVHPIGIYLTDLNPTGMHLMSVHRTGMYPLGAYAISVDATGIYSKNKEKNKVKVKVLQSRCPHWNLHRRCRVQARLLTKGA